MGKMQIIRKGPAALSSFLHVFTFHLFRETLIFGGLQHANPALILNIFRIQKKMFFTRANKLIIFKIEKECCQHIRQTEWQTGLLCRQVERGTIADDHGS